MRLEMENCTNPSRIERDIALKIRKFRRFNNITQFISFSDNSSYVSVRGREKQGSYYCSNAFSKTKFNAFKEEREVDFLHSFQTLTQDDIEYALKI